MHQLRIPTLFALALVSCMGCASTIQMEQSDAEKLHGARLRTVHYPAPALRAATVDKVVPGAVVGGLVGATISDQMCKAAGRKLVAKYNVPDPALMIRDLLARELATYYRFKEVTNADSSELRYHRNPSKIVTESTGADVVLDVRTTRWAVGYFPRNWKRYRVDYGAEARMISVADNRILARTSAYFGEPFDNASQAPTYQELMDNEAALLKAKLRSAAETCVSEMKVTLMPDLAVNPGN